MTNPDARPATGTLPGYLSAAEAAKFAGFPIGGRPLSVFEEGDMLDAGLERDAIADMTPEDLHTQADLAVDLSELFLGS